MPVAIQTTANFKGDHLSVNMFTEGEFLNVAVRVLDAATTAGSNVVSSASAPFNNSMIGWTIYVEGAGPAGAGFVSIITDILSVTSARCAGIATGTVTGAEGFFGPDATASFQNANDAIAVTKPNGGTIRVPKGLYLTTDTINVSSHVRFEGECYVNTSVYGDTTVEPPSFVRCVNAVPVFATDGAPCYSPAFSMLGISGVPESGSKGIYGLTVWNCEIESCFFENFGDQAIHLEKFDAAPTFSVTALIRNNFAQNCVRVRTRADYIGVFDLGPTDCFVRDNNCNASMDNDGIISNFIAALAIRGVNSFVGPNQCGHSEIGVYVDTDCSHAVFVNCRADNNQGRGWVIEGSQNGFIGCRSFANSQATDGGYNAFEIYGGGNALTACRIGWNGLGFGPLSYRVDNGFVTFNDNTTEPNYAQLEAIQEGAYLGAEYVTSGTQAFPRMQMTAFDPIGRRSLRLNEADLSLRDTDFLMVAEAGPVDEKVWRTRLNYGVGFSQLVRSTFTDDYVTEDIYEVVSRTAGVVDYVEFQKLVKALAALHLTGDLEITSGKITFQASTTSVSVGNGSPETVVTAVGGSIYLDYGGSKLWLKASGAGNTGWLEVTPGASTLPVVDTTAIVKGSGDATKLVRIEADGLTTATTRVATMPDRDLTINQLETDAGAASVDLNLTNAYTDITDDFVTLSKAGKWLITATVTFYYDPVDTGNVSAQLLVNGSTFGAVITDDRHGTFSVSRTWLKTGVTAGWVAKIQAKKGGGAGASVAYSGSSDIIAVFLG